MDASEAVEFIRESGNGMLSAKYNQVADLIESLTNRVAELESLAPTDGEITRLVFAGNLLTEFGYRPTGKALKDTATRLRPPKIEWHDHGEASLAIYQGWSLAVGPSLNGTGWCYGVRKLDENGMSGNEICGSRQSAKDHAEAWVRKQVLK